MKIERIQVEDGFLDGLDLSFQEGLNVLIGGRGTGKTSIIELIRFCLDIRGYTDASQARSREHALSVLGPGQVTLTLTGADHSFRVARTAEDRQPRTTESFLRPLIFSQTDIESLGLEASGRIRLVDGFVRSRGDIESATSQVVAEINSLTAEMRELAHEIEAFDGQLKILPEIEQQLQQVAAQEKAMSARSKQAEAKQAQLQDLSSKVSSSSIRVGVFSRTLESFQGFTARLDRLLSSPPSIERWPHEAGPLDKLVPVRLELKSSIQEMGAAKQRLLDAITAIERLNEDEATARTVVEQQARAVRRDIEAVEQGAGSVSRSASMLREKLAQLQVLTSLKAAKTQRLGDVRKARDNALDRLDAIREERFRHRTAAITRLNDSLKPRIRILGKRAAQYLEYVNALTAALRGSGLKYNELAASLAQRLSPRELVELVEGGDFETLAVLAEISEDRAARLANHVRGYGTESILTCTVDDDFDFQLLDGKAYKSMGDLSTGQRCTVILPITLQHKERVLIVDQPEDHLDNAFIVDTLIKSIITSAAGDQIIFSSHNANIPVLGNASQVVLLRSDGRRGFVEHCGPLDDFETVQSITTVMEGGREAFERRAEFYRQHTSTHG